ncbi:hypothetical protein ACLEVS_18050 [Escherichia coli]
MRNHSLTFTVTIPARPDFTGPVLVSVEKGTATGGYTLQKNEFVSNLDGFLEAAKIAGFTVTPPAA